MLLNWSTNAFLSEKQKWADKRFPVLPVLHMNRNPWDVTHPSWQPSVDGIFSLRIVGIGEVIAIRLVYLYLVLTNAVAFQIPISFSKPTDTYKEFQKKKQTFPLVARLAWCWFKDRRRVLSLCLHTFLSITSDKSLGFNKLSSENKKNESSNGKTALHLPFISRGAVFFSTSWRKLTHLALRKQ